MPEERRMKTPIRLTILVVLSVESSTGTNFMRGIFKVQSNGTGMLKSYSGWLVRSLFGVRI